jgi:choice-of-anchor B domain-containing protein
MTSAAVAAASAASLQAQNLRFGSTVVVGEGEVIVAEGTASYRPGTVYLYRETGSTWKEAGTLTAPDARVRDGFGSSLALEGETLVISQIGGAVHVYRRAGGSWQPSGSIAAPAGTAPLRFGTSLALAGEWLLVGAPGQIPGLAGGRRGGGGGGGGGGRQGGGGEPQPAGAVHVYRKSGNEWTHQGSLSAADASPGDAFGAAIAIANGRALIGAPGKDNGAGSAYEFRLDPATSAWTQFARLQPRAPQRGANFGSSVAWSGDAAVAGLPGSDGGYGAVLQFRRAQQNAGGQQSQQQQAAWQEQARLAVGGTGADRFGSALVIDGNQIWAGSPGAGENGAVYEFALDSAGAVVSAPAALRGTGGNEDAGFGRAAAIRGNIAAVGAPNGAGTVTILERDRRSGWRERARFVAPPDAIAQVTGGEVRCGDNGKAHVFDCKDVELLGYLPIHKITMDGGRGTRMSGMWGWTDAKTGREYALLGRNNGTSFVDITDPKNPVFLGDLPLTPGARPSSWREIKVYKDHAYIVSDGSGPHGMQVFDLTQLRTVKKPTTFQPTAHYTRVNSVHNIVINEESGFAYAVGSSAGGETCGGGLHMMDIRDPRNPRFVGCFAHQGTGRRGTGYTHDAQCVMYRGPDTRFQGREVCLKANETALSIVDVSDKQTPKILARAEYPNVGYTHQGWLTDDQKYFYVNDETDETGGLVTATRTLVWDLSNLENPRLAKEFLGTTQASDHNLYVAGNTMYQSNYAAGLRIIDISDRENPVEVGYFDTAPYSPNTPGFSGTWSNYPFFKSGTIAVTSGGEGLLLLKKRAKPVT